MLSNGGEGANKSGHHRVTKSNCRVDYFSKI